MTNILRDENNVAIAYNDTDLEQNDTPQLAFDFTEPFTKSKNIRILKIQLGLSCNYACVYCSQRFVARPEELTKAEISGFMKKLDNLNFSERQGLRIEIWGGEPFVYYKTMVPLVSALKERFKDWSNPPTFSVITNGSLLNDNICEWLIENDFRVAISHDGPGQHLRGPDPFTNPKLKETVLKLYSVLRPQNKMSFNAMLNKHNISRKAIYDWFVDFTGDPNVPLGEGGLIDPYDEGGYDSSISDEELHLEFRRTAFNEIRSTGGNIGFLSQIQKIDQFGLRILRATSNEQMGQKCGMDDPEVLAVDLKGNVLTCQNTSIAQTAPNGESHKAGNIEDINNVKVKSSTHWRDRPECSSCPVLALCQGSCMYLQGDYWNRACDNSFTDNIVFFALAFEKLTGMIPVYIDAEHLPENRKNIWGTYTP